MSLSRTGRSGITVSTASQKAKSLQSASGIPGPPLSVTATVTGNTTASLTWSSPTIVGDSAVTSYTATGGGTVAVSGTTGTVTGLTKNTSYTFAVSASNAVGSGPTADAASVTTTDYSAATGGTEATVNNYNGTGQTWKTHTFTSNGNFVITDNANFNVLAVGGGGGGSWHHNGPGAPGGGIATHNDRSIPAATKAVVIGSGGPGGIPQHAGGNTTFDGVTASGSGGSTGSATSHNISGSSVNYDGGMNGGGTYGKGGADHANSGHPGSAGVVVIAYRVG